MSLTVSIPCLIPIKGISENLAFLPNMIRDKRIQL